MMQPAHPKPISRGALRRFLGREYFILKRRAAWLRGDVKWARPQSGGVFCPHEVSAHRSLILRPLQGLDMQLQENKRTNLALAVEQLDNTLMLPGQTFSFWRLVGRPTRRRGYIDGLVLRQGQVTKGIGGGLCQFGNLIFWIAAHSALTITERYRHGYDVFPDVKRRVPFGAGATLAYNYIDLQIRNDTEEAYRWEFFLDGTHLNGALRASAPDVRTYEVQERDPIIRQEWWGGYTRHNRIVKVATDPNGEARETLLAENHAIMMYRPFLEASS